MLPWTLSKGSGGWTGARELEIGVERARESGVPVREANDNLCKLWCHMQQGPAVFAMQRGFSSNISPAQHFFRFLFVIFPRPLHCARARERGIEEGCVNVLICASHASASESARSKRDPQTRM